MRYAAGLPRGSPPVPTASCSGQSSVTVVRRRSGAKPETITLVAIDVLASELAAFADAVEGRAPYPVPEQDVLATLAAFEAALHSMQTGRPVTLDG